MARIYQRYPKISNQRLAMRIDYKRTCKRRHHGTAFGRHLAFENVEARLMLSANFELPITTVTDDEIGTIHGANFVDISRVAFEGPSIGWLLDGSHTLNIVPIRVSLGAFNSTGDAIVNQISPTGADVFHYNNGTQIERKVSFLDLNRAYHIRPITPIDLTRQPVGELTIQTASVLQSAISPGPTKNSSSTEFHTVHQLATAEPLSELVDITMTLISSAAVDPLILEAKTNTTVATHDLFFAEVENERSAIPVPEFFAEWPASAASSMVRQLDAVGSRGRAQAFEIATDTPPEIEHRGILLRPTSHETEATTSPSLGLPQTTHSSLDSANTSPDLTDSFAMRNAHHQPTFVPRRTRDRFDVERGAVNEDEGSPPLLHKRTKASTSTSSMSGAYKALAVIGGLVFAQGWWATDKRNVNADADASHYLRWRQPHRSARDV
jgi:hypothetical protein